MYAVSQAYIEAKNKIPQTHTFRLTGTVGNVPFTQRNVLQGSMSITNKMSNGNDVLVGSVNIGVLKATFLGIEISEGADITLSEGLLLADQTYEDVPLGIFRVSEANTTKSGTQVTAYDRMSFFTKRFNLDTTYGTPYALASFACQECGVTLGMSQAEMEALPNGTEELWLYTENDIETWQDFIFWLAQAMACFATVDRQGRLVFRPYRQSADDTIDSHRRVDGASFSRFVSRYSGISVVNLEDRTTSYYGLPDDRYLTYNLGSNPFLQYGNDTVKTRIRTAVLNGIANIAYTPFQAQVQVGALYDLGDVIEHVEGLAEGSELACVMSYTWTLNRGYRMEGVGKDPSLTGAKSKVDKMIQGLLGQMAQDTIQYYLFQNAYAIEIGDGEEERIINIRFASNKPTVVVFHAEVLLDVETTVVGTTYFDAVGRITYIYNEQEIETYHPTETWVDGNHILHLLYYFEIETAMINHLQVLLEMSGGSAYITAGGIKSSIYGQALVASDRWDGTIEIEESVQSFAIGTIEPVLTMGVATSVSTSMQVPIPSMVVEQIGNITIGQIAPIEIMGITDDISVEIKGVEE